jgi:triacylglycerol lipase
MKLYLDSIDLEDYTNETAAVMANIINLASHRIPDDKASKILQNMGFSVVHFFNVEETDTQFAICHADDYDITIIAFPGTHGINDINTDSNFDMVKCHPSGNAHRGFMEAADSCKVIISDYLSEEGCNGDVFVTGHSLGGALAVEVGRYLDSVHNCINGIYTFAAPRIGDKEYAKHTNAYMGQSVYRIVYNDDFVAHLPPAFLGYRHFGKLISIDRKGNIRRDVKWINNLFGWLWRIHPSAISIKKTHKLSNYIRHLMKHIKGEQNGTKEI